MISLNRVTKRFGSRVLYENADLQIRPGEKIGLVGPNGAGKTTIFRVITGEEPPDGGEVAIVGRTVIGYFSQDVGEMSGRSALAEVKAGAGRVSELGEWLAEVEKRLENSIEVPIPDDEMGPLMERYGEAQMEFQQRGGWDLDSRCKEILTGLGIGPDAWDLPVESFSGGWKMRIALAKILALNPDALLMDEPTNHLDIESILWLEEWIRNFPGAIVMTSHDREFMNRLVDRIVEVADRTITSYSGNYEFYLRERGIRRQQQVAAFERQQEMLAKEEEFIARFAARASHAAQVQSRVKKLEKIDRLTLPTEIKRVQMVFETPPRSGNDVVRMEGLGKTWTRTDGKVIPVFSGISGVIQRLSKIAVTGVNGAGKSTFMKCIVGETSPTVGTCVLGANVKVGYFSQHAMDSLTGSNTVFEEVSSRLPDASVGWIRNLLGAFLFSGDDVDKKISQLSGGEKSRVALAIILASKVNFLVLDEPTNHLDIDSRETLMEAVRDFDGTVMVVSHDRWFLRQIANKVFEISHGHMRIFDGNYDYYLEKKAAEAPKA